MNVRDTMGNSGMVIEFRLGNIELVLFNLKMYFFLSNATNAPFPPCMYFS